MREQIIPIVAKIWEAFISSKVQEAPEGANLIDAADEKQGSTIGITGDRACTVAVCAPPILSQQFMALITGIPAEDLAESEIQAMTNELANLIGGNLKTELVGKNCLLLPEEVDMTDKVIGDLFDGEPLIVEFTTDFGPLQVAVK